MAHGNYLSRWNFAKSLTISKKTLSNCSPLKVQWQELSVKNIFYTLRRWKGVLYWGVDRDILAPKWMDQF